MAPSETGVFLSLEGMDGSGKSTQLALLVDWLTKEGREPVVCREPGGTAIGETIREILLSTRSQIGMRAEMLLYMASRAQLVEDIIRPALDQGQVVLCDRFLLSTIVYQGHAGGLDPEVVRQVGLAGTGNLQPSWIGVLDLPAEVAASRRRGPADRIELRSLEYHQRVRDGYLAEAARDPNRITVVDALKPPEEIHSVIRAEVSRALAR